VASANLRSALKAIGPKVSGGKRLSEIARSYPGQFPNLAIAMIEAGETGGRLDTMLVRLAQYAEREVSLRALIARETFYPKILLLAVLLIPLAAPVAIAAIQGSTGAAIGILFKWLFIYALALGLPALAITMVVRSYGKTTAGRRSIDAFKLRLPVLGKVIHRVAMSKFCRALAALYDAGVPITQALRLAGDATGNARLQSTAVLATPIVERGGKLSEGLGRAGMLDDLVLRMLQTGEESGHIDEMMDKVADYYEAESETAIKQMSLLVVPFAVVVAGIVVVLILAKAYMGYATSMVGN
jgi:type IV pilus assembly protein PilC